MSKNPVPEFRRSLVFEVITQNDQDEDVEVGIKHLIKQFIDLFFQIPYIKYNFRR